MARRPENGSGGSPSSGALPVLMTVDDVAKLTGRTANAVVAAIQRGEIPAHKLGSRRWWIRSDQFLALFEGGNGRS